MSAYRNKPYGKNQHVTNSVHRYCLTHSVFLTAATFLFFSSAVNAQVAAESAAIRAGAATRLQKGVTIPKAPLPRAAMPAGNTISATPPPNTGLNAPASPSTTIQVADNTPSCAGGLPEPTRVRLSAGKATLVNLPEPVVRRTLGDPVIVDGRMVSPTVLYLVAGRIGATNAILQGQSGRCTVLDIVVALDIEAIKTKLTEVMPNETNVRITAAADSLVISGWVSDSIAAEHVISIANAYVRAAYQQGITGSGAGAGANSPQQFTSNGITPLSVRVVNLLSVAAAQQVMLEVKIAEVSKTILDKLGASFGVSRTNGNWSYQLLSNFLTGLPGSIAGVGKSLTGNGISIEAEKKDGVVRILAEPNVMAISGQEGSFLAGGKILIPVSQREGLSGGLTIALEEKEYGVGLKFTPTVLADGRINLKVAPEVSELSREGVGISLVNSSGSSVFPLITTRRASTTVQLFDGQSFAIGGLIKSSQSGNIKAVPFLGDIPILGALFRSNDFQEEKTELVFVVTPRLVKPLPSQVRLPTDRVGEISRQGMILNGQLDSPGTAVTTPPAPASGMQVK